MCRRAIMPGLQLTRRMQRPYWPLVKEISRKFILVVLHEEVMLFGRPYFSFQYSSHSCAWPSDIQVRKRRLKAWTTFNHLTFNLSEIWPRNQWKTYLQEVRDLVSKREEDVDNDDLEDHQSAGGGKVQLLTSLGRLCWHARPEHGQHWALKLFRKTSNLQQRKRHQENLNERMLILLDILLWLKCPLRTAGASLSSWSWPLSESSWNDTDLFDLVLSCLLSNGLPASSSLSDSFSFFLVASSTTMERSTFLKSSCGSAILHQERTSFFLRWVCRLLMSDKTRMDRDCCELEGEGLSTTVHMFSRNIFLHLWIWLKYPSMWKWSSLGINQLFDKGVSPSMGYRLK